jgi:hypothetical protein
MVPHRQFLQLVGLISLIGPAGQAHAVELQDQYAARSPIPFSVWVEEQTLVALPPVVRVLLQTTDMPTTGDYRPLFQAAAALNLDAYLAMGPLGPTVQLPTAVETWRTNDTARLFVEVCMLCSIPDAQIQEDMHRIYNTAVDAGDLACFRRLFMDVEFALGPGWAMYERAIGVTEARFKRQLVSQPHDYVRWRLGVPVQLKSEAVLDRLVSDAYFTERMLKGQAGEMGIRMGKDEMARMKLERDTIFKGMVLQMKLKAVEADKGGGDVAKQIQDTLAGIAMLPDLDPVLTVDNLTDGEEQPVSE